MTREEASKILIDTTWIIEVECFKINDTETHRKKESSDKLYHKAEKVQEAIKILTSAPEWISVEEQLPECHQEVEVCFHTRSGIPKIDIGYLNAMNKEWILNKTSNSFQAEFWKPLPSPPDQSDHS